MSKSATTIASSCRMHMGRLCAAFSLLILLPSASALAAAPDPVLRRSDQLDVSRLGKVSEDERSVLRVEWRAAVTGGDEARTVQNMLDSLRHIEETLGAIGRLIRSMPVQQPIVAPVAVEPPESSDFNTRLALANITVAGLVALWWFRRRNSARSAEAKATLKTPTDAGPPIAPVSSGISPTTASTTEAAPLVAASPAPLATPSAKTVASALTTVQQEPVPVTPVAQARAEERSPEPRAATAAIQAAPPPAPITTPAVERMAAPKAPEVMPSAPLPAMGSPAIDFSLEDADPEVVAREDAKLKRLKITPPPEAAAQAQDTKVEPTLQLAEIMLSMGLEQGAAQALVEYTEANPRQAVYHWLKLLGIYRSKGLVKEYKETAEKLRQHFNIQAEDTATPGIGEAPTLEDFPRVMQHIQEVWRQPKECLSYLQHLLEDNREGSRAGFPLAVAEEILWLIEILKADEA